MKKLKAWLLAILFLLTSCSGVVKTPKDWAIYIAVEECEKNSNTQFNTHAVATLYAGSRSNNNKKIDYVYLVEITNMSYETLEFNQFYYRVYLSFELTFSNRISFGVDNGIESYRFSEKQIIGCNVEKLIKSF